MKSKFAIIFSVLLLFSAFGYSLAANPNGSVGQDKKEEARQRNEERRGENADEEENSVEIESVGNKLKIKKVGKNATDFELEGGEESTESGEFDTDPEDDDSLEIKANGNASLVIKNKLAAQTKFPLRVNLDTNELIVNTPKGSKVVTVLPDAAVANMLAANVLDHLGGKGGILWVADNPTPTATVSATPTLTATVSATPTGEEPDASPSGEPTQEPEEGEEPVIELTLSDDGVLVYNIRGKKLEKLLGLIQVELDRVVVVSAETGELVEIDQSFLTDLLDLISF